jgi:hypothetical protein
MIWEWNEFFVTIQEFWPWLLNKMLFFFFAYRCYLGYIKFDNMEYDERTQFYYFLICYYHASVVPSKLECFYIGEKIFLCILKTR